MVNSLENSRTVRVLNVTRGTIVGEQIAVADGPLSRLVGLLGKSLLAPGCGLLISPSQGVHTFGMKFPIDLLFLDRHMRVVKVREALKPQRMTGLSWRTESVLELPVDCITNSGTAIGDQMLIESAAETPEA